MKQVHVRFSYLNPQQRFISYKFYFVMKDPNNLEEIFV